jgi:hypothetical protein
MRNERAGGVVLATMMLVAVFGLVFAMCEPGQPDTPPVPPHTTVTTAGATSTSTSTTTTTVDQVALHGVLGYLAHQRDAWYAHFAPKPAVRQWVATGGGAPCGGDLPPCWRIYGTESGGNWSAYNAGGCDGHSCFGPFQFSGTWACKLGLPCDLRSATKGQWVNAARLLWNGGKGCANWSACS